MDLLKLLVILFIPRAECRKLTGYPGEIDNSGFPLGGSGSIVSTWPKCLWSFRSTDRIRDFEMLVRILAWRTQDLLLCVTQPLLFRTLAILPLITSSNSWSQGPNFSNLFMSSASKIWEAGTIVWTPGLRRGQKLSLFFIFLRKSH